MVGTFAQCLAERIAVQGLALGHINYFEEEESERAWRFATSTLADTLWDPSITTESIQVSRVDIIVHTEYEPEAKQGTL